MSKEIIQQAVSQSSVAAPDARASMQNYIKQMQGEIKKALPSVITPERFTRIVLSALSSNPKLAQTTPQSFLAAMMTAAQLGMEINTPLGQAYLIPFKNKGKLECQFVLGVKGMLDLVYRNENVQMIQAHCVYENDYFSYAYGLNPKLEHIPSVDEHGNRGNMTHVYALYRLSNNGYGFQVMSKRDIDMHAEKYSKAYNSTSSPWVTSYDSMALKTVVKKLLKYAPLKTDVIRAVNTDSSIKNELSVDMSEVVNEIDYEEAA